MSHFVPKSFFGQTLLILLAGLVVSHAIGAWIYTSDRAQAVRAVGGFALAQRVANITRLLEDTPPEWQSRLIASVSDPTFRVSLASSTASLPPTPDGIARAVADFVAQQFGDGPARAIRVAVAGESSAPPFAPPFAPSFTMPFDHTMPMAAMMHGFGTWQGLQVAVQLAGGSQWVSFATALPDTGPGTPWQFMVSLAVMGLIVLAVSAWAVRRVTSPLGLLAGAAERLGRDVGAEPIPEIGTAEMRKASHAFNQMQERLRRLVDNRMRMLAAISHDLRTPLTLLRLRAETVENPEERGKMLASIAEMDSMIGATLAFARDEAKSEPRRRTDVAALLGSIVDDMAEAGLAVAMEPSESAVCECQSGAIKRAIVNLLDNALKYGERARTAISATASAITVTIDDDGPGIPPAELGKVMQPFYRLEGSRSRDTGGIGLGLAIALAVVEAHGGQLLLANRPEGGLRASVTLPR